MSFFTHIWSELSARYAARHEPENIRPLAELYWRALLILTVVMIVGTIFWGIATFVSVVTTLSSTPPGSGAAPVALDRKKLEMLLAAYAARETEFDQLKAESRPYPDPSK